MSNAKERRRAILIVDHGSRRPEANASLAEIAALVRRVAPEDHVEIAHLEIVEPSIAQGFAACVSAGAREVVIHPYMLAPGRHASRDIPELAREAAANHPGVTWCVTAPLGVDQRLAELIVERVREAEARENAAEDPSHEEEPIR